MLPQLRGRGEPRASHGRLTVVMRSALWVAGAAVLLAACSSGQPRASSPATTATSSTPTRPTPTQAADPGRAVVSVHLDQTTVPAGTTIEGIATIDNRTGAPIRMSDGTCDGWLFVGLANSRLSYEPAISGVACAPYAVPVGVSQHPITVVTTYQSCTQTPSRATYRLPVCLAGSHDLMPALPPGVYHTAVVVQGPLVAKNSVTVILTSPVSSP